MAETLSGTIEVVARTDDLFWEKQPQETPRAYAAFLSYRNLPPMQRSLKRAVITMYGAWSQGRQRQFQEWSRLNAWVMRANAWDQEQVMTADRAKLAAIEEMTKRHINVAKAAQQKAIERLRDLEPEELGVIDLLRYLEFGAKLERLSLGEPTEIETPLLEQNIIVDYSSLTTSELVQALARKKMDIRGTTDE